ncbi:hypothetical protein JCGZ_06687 [Jatropha curcas]|uniref:LOB domain-containing protein n=1 Tax=Jatropha curcas TaxID=180498 RepID=A0A067LCH1_JATCU|nr:hypothetical protein JCGZ_06687 [Jatropha curcas]
MGNNPFLFPSTVSYSQPSLPSSPSFNSYIPSPSPSLSFDSYSPSSPSLNSPFQFYQSLPSPPSQISSNHFGTPSADAVGPCAACTILHRRCTDKCYLASYFPQGVEPHNFTVVDSLFGLSNVVELLQQNSNSLSYVPLLLLLRDTSKDGSQLQANPSKISNIASTGTPVNINGQPMLANFENSKAHSYNSSSKPPMMFGTNHAGTLTSPVNKFGDNNDLEFQVNKADMEDESLKGNVAPQDDTEGFTFVEVNSVRASADKVVCCDFSSDGKLLASGGHDKKVGHYEPIDSLCWDPSGQYLASVSVDSVRLWGLQSGSVLKCVHVLSCVGNKFQSCIFHPTDPSLLVIGGYQSLELWNMAEKKSMTLPAHEGLISALAVSPSTELIASASHDKFVKLWK